MCGLIGAVSRRDIKPILIEGLKRLEYRGYDSAGVAFLNGSGALEIQKRVGKIRDLENVLNGGLFKSLTGWVGIGHTRWATHGAPDERNAHPQTSNGRIAVVHNGIIENYRVLKSALERKNYIFLSDTDTEVIAHLIHDYRKASQSLLEAVQDAAHDLSGSFAIAVIDISEPDAIIVARRNSPLVIGIGDGEHFVASDIAALLPMTRRFIYLEQGDVAELKRDSVRVYNSNGRQAVRPIHQSELTSDMMGKGKYGHYMLKEIFEQPDVLSDTLQGCIADGVLLQDSLGFKAHDLLRQIEAVHIVACGSSYHAAEVARYWLESVARIPCNVEVASEYHCRRPVIPRNCLFVALSQSGETGDTLAALRYAKLVGYLATLAVCNVPESSLIRESDLTLLTRAGAEIGVAATKTFTTQLLSMLMLTILLGRRRVLSMEEERRLTGQLRITALHVKKALGLNDKIKALAEHFVNRGHAMFLGRGPMYSIAKEGALKFKQIAYIHAEAHAAGELKHGPLALVDHDMPMVAVAPNDEWLGKVMSNLEKVRSRGGELFVFTSHETGITPAAGIRVIEMPATGDVISPLIYTVPLQLLAYHVAVIKGTNVDQPRNQAKSITVE